MHCFRKLTLAAVVATLFAGGLLTLAWTTQAPAADSRVVYGAAGVGSVAYVMAGGLAELVSQKANGVKMIAQITRGFEENVRLVDSGELDFAMTSSVLLDQALKGIKPYAKKYTNMRAVAVAIVSPVQCGAYRSAGIKNMADLKGKRVNIGPAGSSSAFMTGVTLAAYGLEDAVTKEHLSFVLGGRALQDRKIDAICIVGAPPFPAVVEAAAAGNLRLIPLDRDGVGRISAKYPSLFGYTIKKGTYRGQDADIFTVAYNGFTVANKKVPDAVVHEVLRVMMSAEGRKQLSSVHRAWDALALNPGLNELKAIGLRLHPAAEKFWREQGYKIPPEIAAPK